MSDDAIALAVQVAALRDKIARIRALCIYDKRLIGETKDTPVFALHTKDIVAICDEEEP